MPLAANLRFQDYQFQQETPSGYWRWTTRMDLTGPSPAFSVRDITSPYGILRDSIPIPGIVIQSMSDSIANLWSNFVPTFSVSPLSLSFTLDEGRGYGDPETVGVSNTGVFGSLLDATITTDAPYVVARPARLSNLASMERGCFEVVVTSTDLLAASSPYLQTVTLQDPSATNGPITIPVTITVRPKAVIEVSATSLTFYAIRPLTGAFDPIPAQSFILTNTGDPASRLEYVIQRLTGNSPWLSGYTPLLGELMGGGGQDVTVTVAPSASCPPGTYTEILRISGYSTTKYVDVTVTLVVT